MYALNDLAKAWGVDHGQHTQPNDGDHDDHG